jgi:hypothetical protein
MFIHPGNEAKQDDRQIILRPHPSRYGEGWEQKQQNHLLPASRLLPMNNGSGPRSFLKIGCCGTTADPSTTLLRSSGRDDKERVAAYLGSCDWVVWISGGRVGLISRRLAAGKEPKSAFIPHLTFTLVDRLARPGGLLSHPSQKARRIEGWGTQSFLAGQEILASISDAVH